MVKELNEHLSNSENDIDSEYVKYNKLSYEPEEIANKMIISLDKDVPVIFLTNLNSEVICEGVDVDESDELKTHYVTVTGINVDTIKGEITLIISTWSYKANVYLNDFYDEKSFGSKVIVLES